MPKKERNDRKIGKRTGEPVKSVMQILEFGREFKQEAVSIVQDTIEGSKEDRPAGYSYGYTVKDAIADKADRIAYLLGRTALWAIIISAVLMLLLAITGAFLEPYNNQVGALLIQMAIAILLIGIGLPVFLLWFVGVPLGAIIGMQMVYRWGFLASVPFSLSILGMTWPMVAGFIQDVLRDSFGLYSVEIWTFQQPSWPVFSLGLALSVVLMVIMGVVKKVSLRPRAVQIAQESEEDEPVVLMPTLRQEQTTGAQQVLENGTSGQTPTEPPSRQE